MRIVDYKSEQKGYTLVEVSLATIFVGVIVMVLGATTINVIRSYNKGIWLSQINQAGQQLNADISDKTRYSSTAVVDNASRRLCVGGVSYLWNTEQDILENKSNNRNRFTDNSLFSLVRIHDPSAEYCSNKNKQPNRTDANVRLLLGRGATIQEFNVSQGVNGDGGENIPLLSLNTVISTDGSNRPIRAYKSGDGYAIDANDTVDGSQWMCGDWSDTGDEAGRVDNNDRFEPANNQYCSFAEYNIIVYERSE